MLLSCCAVACFALVDALRLSILRVLLPYLCALAHTGCKSRDCRAACKAAAVLCSRFCFRVRFSDTCSCLVVLLLALRWSMHCGCLSCGRCCHICARSHTQFVSRAMVVLLAWLLRCFARAFAFVCVSLTLALVLLCRCLLCAQQGGVAHVDNGGTFNAYDCTISGNSAVRDGCCGRLKIA